MGISLIQMNLQRVVMIAALFATSACQRGSIGLDLAEDGDVVHVAVSNGLAIPIVHSETVIAAPTQPDRDLILIFERDGERAVRCLTIDQVPLGRREVPPGGRISFSADSAQLSALYCLAPGGEYQVRAAYIERDRDGYRVVATSNPESFVAKDGWRGEADGVLSLSEDGSRVFMGPPQRPRGGARPAEN